MTDADNSKPTKSHEANSAADDWASAMAEQGSAEQASTTDTKAPWDEALAEQGAGETAATTLEDVPAAPAAVAQSVATVADDRIFKPLADSAGTSTPRDLDVIMEIPVTLSVELGETRLTIRELLDLAQGSVIELDGFAGEPMDIQINGYLVAQGEVVVVDDRYGIRITDIITPSERIHKLNR